MAAEGRRSDASLTARLAEEPERFALVQAVRILEHAAARTGRDPDARNDHRVGGDLDPRDEAVLLRADLELAFPTAELAGFAEGPGRPALSVTAIGLNGPSGVLPAYYSEMVLAAQRSRNAAMRDFLDLFNHRAISLFVRASDKYRLSRDFEVATGSTPVGGRAALYALIGFGEPSLQNRLAVSDQVLGYYAGHYAHQPRTAAALGQILTDYFEQPARVLQFQGSWGFLPANEQSRVGGAFARLGLDTVCGSKVFDIQGGFRIGLGPLTYAEFEAFLPGSARLAELASLTRSYVGPDFTFDVQLVLKADEIPPLGLSSDPARGGRLGWNTWLPTPGGRADANEAVFRPEAA
jgi:type VI secretion system protein ImpH